MLISCILVTSLRFTRPYHTILSEYFVSVAQQPNHGVESVRLYWTMQLIGCYGNSQWWFFSGCVVFIISCASILVLPFCKKKKEKLMVQLCMMQCTVESKGHKHIESFSKIMLSHQWDRRRGGRGGSCPPTFRRLFTHLLCLSYHSLA